MRVQNQRFALKSASAVRVRGLLLTLFAALHQGNSEACQRNHERCREDSDGVHDLDCFGKHFFRPRYLCTWRPGRGPSVKTYTLHVARSREWKSLKGEPCKSYPNITGTSKDINVFPRRNLSVEIFERGNSGICTKAVFQGFPLNLLRCGPPDSVSLSRCAGRIAVNVSWEHYEMKKITRFAVRYRAQGNWSESQSENATAATLEGVNSSRAYAVQVRCVINSECTQCTWSRAYDVPPELTTAPELEECEDADAAETPGRRRLSLSWKFTSRNAHDGYQVTIGKASGEAPREAFRTTEPRMVFILSYSSYHLEISAFNNASASPPLCHTVRRREAQLGFGAEEPDVTVHSSRSLTISLRDNQTKYVCYCAEWMERGRDKVAFMSYYSPHASRKLNLENTLEPYRRYTLTVHARPDKDGCNMKHINNSESTYGSTQFYLREGSPIGAPANLSSFNVTHDSAVLQWASIPEEDTQGFLLGYVIYYTEYQKKTRMEDNVTVNPDVSSHTLEGLKSGTSYEVQLSGFTRSGVGVRSEATAFTTDRHDNSPFSGIIKAAAIVTAVVLFGSPIIKRAKRILWPSIPNPEKSNMMRKMETTNELELLQSISTLKVEEWDTDSLQIVQKEEAITTCISAEMPSLLDRSDDEFGDVQETRLNAAPMASGYTTMEMFRQGVTATTPVSQEREPDGTVLRSQLDYVRQFSTESTCYNQPLP